MSRLVSNDLAATLASMDYYISLFGVGKRSYGAQNSAAFVCSVARVNVNVKRAKAKRAVIARGVAKRQNLFSAILADKSVIVF